jgi:hypothetical protein
MWRKRRKIVLSGHELLKVTRPDVNFLKVIRLSLFSFTSLIFSFLMYNAISAKETNAMAISLVCIFGFLSFIILFEFTDHHIIFTDKGIADFAGGILWEDIQSYCWIAFLTHYPALDFDFSNNVPKRHHSFLFRPRYRFFGPIHESYKEKIDQLFAARGIKQGKFNLVYKDKYVIKI